MYRRYETNEFDDIDEEIKSDYVAGFREHNNGINLIIDIIILNELIKQWFQRIELEVKSK